MIGAARAADAQPAAAPASAIATTAFFGNPFRSTAFVRQFAIMAAVQTALVGGALLLAGPPAAATSGACALCGLLLFLLFSWMRCREIARLAQDMDEVLHGGRRVGFSDCREGDVSILRNEAAKLVARLMRANELLESEKSALADALADVSHQIRTPLTAMALTVENAARARSEQERREALHELEGMIDRVSWLVTSLLKIAKLDAGALVLEKRPVRAADAISRALDPLAAALDLRGLSCSVDAGEASFIGDERWTAEAIENIVKNCMEATPAGGTLSVRAMDDPLATRIVVTDTGPGIPADDLPRIFERFYRGRPSRAAGEEGSAQTARRSEGFGIGLSLAQSLVSAQGGSLRAGNLAEGGAQFVMAFPKMVV